MQKKLISMLSLLMLVIMVMTTLLTSCGEEIIDGIQNVVEESNNPQKLQILSTGNKLTQEQMMSQIKAEHLKENKGYLDSDKIIAFVQLPGKTLIDKYLEDDGGAKTVAEYAATDAGKAVLAAIEQEQNTMVDQLTREGLIDEVTNTYSTVMNAVAVSTTYGDFKKIEGLDGIQNAILSETYNRPQANKGTDASAINNAVDIYETGIFNSSSVTYRGDGTAVAVLDSGFDCSHTVFANMPTGELWITPEDVEAILSASVAFDKDPTIDLSKVYVNAKIPFAFDYADKDPNVNPYDSEHGTHVAGIIGGKDSVITGVAIDTQLVLMKVFPDLSEGGRSEDILSALEDAVLLNVDAINMSLGSSCGFSRESDAEAINAVYDRIEAAGISLITAASNSYSSAFGGEQGNTNKVTNPDSATVGSPSTYPHCMSVASISGTKSRYLVANGDKVVFFSESNDITGDPNDFFHELYEDLGKATTETLTLEYVTVPGVGMKANYNGINVKGKVALVARGTTTFEDKALQAKNAGAIACIIYNNIEGDILMSMGKTDHIPTISISKELGTALAEKKNGTLSLEASQEAGPFMSDFSSWGPTPDLKLKPEITAHGGNIKSAIPGGGYDEMSGTSMATPNLCGIVVLIRQYLKEKYPEKTSPEISVLCNELLMSTATIALNEQGNPYSPRKQGAGLASLYNVVNTDAFITVDGIDRAKLELGDDPERQGVYEMQFNLENFGEISLSYKFDLLAMTESVSTSDKDFVAEKSYMLGGDYTVSVTGGKYNASTKTITVDAGTTAVIKAVYTLSKADKAYIEESFPYGMYVEGFVTLDAQETDSIDLNVPFLAFYGDWTEAPMFDKTYYEVESEAHNNAIDDEDKIKADYYATTPYGSYFYNYIIPLGAYLYDMDTTKYEAIPGSLDHIAISNALGTIDGISAVYAGLLRNAKTMTYTITDKVTGEVIKELVVDNARKAYSNGASPVPNYEFLRWKTSEMNFVNNRQYEFKMVGVLDYGDGGVDTNVRNSFSFDFYVDTEAPVIKEATYEKEYDKTLKKDRYYMTMTVYDNHYVQSIMPIMFTSTSSYTTLTDNPIPVYSQRGKDTVVRFEITDMLNDLYSGELSTSALGFAIDDYALNSDIYFCQLPGTRGDFKFTKDGNMEGTELTVLSIYENEVVDLTQYLATSDKTVDENKDYLKYLNWTSLNKNVAQVQEGQVRGIKAGRTTIVVQEAFELKQAALLITVKKRPTEEASVTPAAYAPVPTSTVSSSQPSISLLSANDVEDVTDSKIKSIRFSYFNTLFAYSRAAQTSKIGETGDRWYLSSFGGGVSFYPGEKIQLFYDLDPWYTADKYEVTFTSTDPRVASVDEKTGVVTGLKKGVTNIVLRVKGSNITTSLRININSEFVIENRTLVAYKGLGGEVVIPDDEGIVYIGAFAFCLYDTDNSFELDEDDYDANKIPNANTSVTRVVIPDGVIDIQKYAFYNCSALREVVVPDTVRFVREYSFYKNEKLTKIDLSSVETIGSYAFSGCKLLGSDPEAPVNTVKALAMGTRTFENCTSLTNANIASLRTTGKEVFKGCTAMTEVTMSKDTALSEGMFVQSGLVSVDISTTLRVPAFAFAQCENLESVYLHNDFVAIDNGAFCQNPKLKTVSFFGSVGLIGEQAFYDCDALTSIRLPDCAFELGAYAFFECSNLATVGFCENTKITKVGGAAFDTTAIVDFVVEVSNATYSVSADKHLLLSADGKTILLAATGHNFGEYTIDTTYDAIGESAFSGTKITKLTVTNPKLVIGKFAFTNCETLAEVVLPETAGVEICDSAFRYAVALTTVTNLDKVTTVGEYAFANTEALKTVVLGSGATYGEGAFYNGGVKHVTVGANTSFGMGVFQNCKSLETVVMPEEGGVHIGEACFAYDTALKTIDLSKTDDTIENEAFYGCTSLTRADMTHVKHIGTYVFADCANLYYVTMPVVQTIGEGAFSRYERLGAAPSMVELVLPETLVSIGEGAFLGCAGLDTLTLPAGVTRIEDFTFAYCTALRRLFTNGEVTYVGSYGFVGCTFLSEIDLSHATEIGEYTFYQCENLTTVDLTSVVTIGEAAFASAPVSGNIAAPNLTAVGDYAFQKDDAIGGSLTGITAPKLVKIGEAAFRNNRALTAFVFNYYVEEIEVLAFDGCSALATFSMATEDGNKTDIISEDGYARLIGGVLYTKMPSGAYQLASIPGGMNFTNGTFVVEEGVTRINHYAGNSGNSSIKKLVLPASLKLIGDHAFYGYTALKTVEFRSFVAPAWENFYDPNLILDVTDPGYDLLHNQYHLTTYELCYTNFIDLIGKFETIEMVLPANSDVEGYDALPYLATFGKVADATRSETFAMSPTLNDFIQYAEEIMALDKITLANETQINNAMTKYNALKQTGTDFGYTPEEWNAMVTAVLSARKQLSALKLAEASQAAQDLQVKVNTLPEIYTSAYRSVMDEIANALAVLDPTERTLLDLTRYNALRDAYEADKNASADPTPPETPDQPGDTDTPDEDDNNGALIGVIVGIVAAVVVAAAVVVVLWLLRKKRTSPASGATETAKGADAAEETATETAAEGYAEATEAPANEETQEGEEEKQ